MEFVTNAPSSKCCVYCKKLKKLEDFHVDRRKPDGRHGGCKRCRNKNRRKAYAQNPERDRLYGALFRPEQRATVLKRKYNLTPDEYDALLEAQGGGCAICGRAAGMVRLAVDHDHQTGKIRGLLCAACNQGLGLFMDSSDHLQRAVEYLRRSQSRTSR